MRRPGTVEGRSVVRTVDGWSRFTLLTLTIVGMSVVAVTLAVRYRYEPQVLEAVRSTRQVRLAQEAMLDLETSLRGYLLTHDEAFLEPYEPALARLDDANGEASRLLGSDGDRARLLLDMRLAQEAWRNRWADPALQMGASGRTPTEDFLEEGKALFDAYRETNAALGTAVDRRRDHVVRNETRAVTAASLAVIAVTMVLGAYAIVQARRVRRDVSEPFGQLLDRLDQIEAGDLARRPVLQGARELAAISAGVEEAALALSTARVVAADRAAQIEARNRQLGDVLEFGREVAGSLNLRYVLRGVVHTAVRISAHRVVVWLRDEDAPILRPMADSDGPDLAPIGLEPADLGDGLVGRVGRYGRIEGVGRGAIDGAPVPEDELGVPLVVGAQIVGALQITGITEGLPDGAVDVLETLAIHAATAIEAARLHEHTEDLALTDVLTGLPNRRRFDRDLDIEVAAADRYQRPLACAMIDVDHFKRYNDSLGHQAGDVALQQVGRLIQGELRAGDMAYRYGGEELVLLLRETTLTDATGLAERLRRAIEHHFESPTQPRPLTISVGVAAIPDQGRSGHDLVAAADSSLYVAKRTGRNRVITAGSPPD